MVAGAGRDPVRAAAGLRRPFGELGAREGARMQQARRLVPGSGDSPALHRLAELAALLLDAGSSQVSILTDDQTVVAGVGAAAPSVGVPSSSDDSLCGVTVALGAPLVVDDAVSDGRVSALPPVASGTVGSYLGVPLVSDGHRVGALCVFDPAPREWSGRDVEVLSLLAGPVLAELELAAAEDDYDEDRLLWQLAVDAAGVGVFDWDLATGELRWDDRLLELFGHDRETFGGTIEAFSASVHPEDRDRVAQLLETAIGTCSTYEAEYRVVLPSGAVRWISARGVAIAGPDQRAVRLLGAAFDTTAVQEGEARVSRILEAMPSAFYHLDTDWRFTYTNARAHRLLGQVTTDTIGHVIWEIFPDAVGSIFEERYRHAVDTGEPVAFEAHYPAPLDRWYEVRAWPTPDGLSVYFHDITARRTAEEEIKRASERSALLAEITKTLTDTLDAEEGVGRMARLVVPVLADWCVVTLVEGEVTSSSGWRHNLRDIATWHTRHELRPLVDRYAEVRIPALTDASFLARALEEGVAMLIPENASEEIAGVLGTAEARDLCRQLDAYSAVAVPLRGRGRTTGLLTVFRGRERAPFSSDDVETLEDLAGRAGLALDNARAYAEQRDLAEGLQRSMLTAPPAPDHLHVAVRYEPAAEAAQVGGDWYDSFMQPDGATTVVIGDVVGHDTAAAAAMGQVRGLLRGIAVTTGEGPADVLRRVDEAMAVLEIDTTATAVVARFEQTAEERRDGVTRMRWSNAGHPPPLMVIAGDEGGVLDPVDIHGTVVQPSVEVTELWAEETNLLLGLDPHLPRTESVAVLPRGATVLLFTDGLIERRGQAYDEGLERLRTVLSSLVGNGVSLEETCDEVLRQLLPARPDDDVAIVAVRLHTEDRPRPAEAGPGSVPEVIAASTP